jgi:hypothetical protein
MGYLRASARIGFMASCCANFWGCKTTKKFAFIRVNSWLMILLLVAAASLCASDPRSSAQIRGKFFFLLSVCISVFISVHQW